MTYLGTSCPNYSLAVEEAKVRIAELVDAADVSVDPTLSEDEIKQVRYFVQATADWMDINRLDVAHNEIKLIDTTSGGIHRNLSLVNPTGEVSRDLGFALCPGADACVTRPAEPNEALSADILLFSHIFLTGTPRAFPLTTPTKLSFGQCDLNSASVRRYATIVHEGGHVLGINTGKTGMRLPDGRLDPHHAGENIVDTVMGRKTPTGDCYPSPFDVMAIYALYQTR